MSIKYNYRIREQKKVAALQFPNKFEVLKSRVMNIGEGNREEEKKDRKMILKEEKEKKKLVEIRKIAGEREREVLREVTAKIELERIGT